jgi:DNA-binding PadR family transcriptional regulator
MSNWNTSAEPRWLPTTAYAVLGLLSHEQERTAYELKQLADSTIAHVFWAPAQSAIYTELQRLEGLGLASHRVEAESELKPRRLYRITGAGEEALAAWVRAGRFEPAVVKNTTLLRTLYGNVVTGEELAARVEEQIVWAQTEVERLERAVAEAAEPLQAHVLEWALDRMKGEVAASRRLAERLRR